MRIKHAAGKVAQENITPHFPISESLTLISVKALSNSKTHHHAPLHSPKRLGNATGFHKPD